MKKFEKISEYFGINSKDLESKGVFDRVIGIDSKLFVDPSLLNNLDIPEFINSKKKLEDRFRKIIKLLSINDKITFKSAVKLFISREIRGIGIGYGNTSDNGSSIGPELARKLALVGKKIVDLGIKDPEIFELLGLFQEDFGPDRISDFTIHTLRENFFSFTQRVSKELGIKKIKKYKYNGGYISLPYIKETNSYILFLPKNALKDLPIALDRENIEHVIMFNNELREKINKIAGDDWKKYIESKKNRMKEFFSDKKFMESLLKYYKNRDKIPYDFINDPKGEIDWREKGLEIAKKYPINLSISKKPNIEEIKGIARKIIEKFKNVIEHNGVNELLIKGNGRHSERYAQKIFFTVASIYCEGNNLDLSPESKASTGPVDFKISRGLLKVVIEVKLTSNDINSGIIQLQEYEKGEGAEGIYLIIQTGEHQPKIEKFYKLEEDFKEKGLKFPEYYIVDGRIKPTPSNLKLNHFVDSKKGYN